MDFKTLISKRRACKLFNDKKIEQKDLHFILEAGILSPSSHGFEPWKFIVLEHKKHNIKLSTLCCNQENVASASHNIIFLARKDLQKIMNLLKNKYVVLLDQAKKIFKGF
ncbi:hypothetical protein CAHE111092_00565 [Campylobacter hepaticus]